MTLRAANRRRRNACFWIAWRSNGLSVYPSLRLRLLLGPLTNAQKQYLKAMNERTVR